MSFESLGEPLVKAVNELGYTSPTPIQQQAIPAVLGGGDPRRRADGTGKTAGFTLPILQRLHTFYAEHRGAKRAGARADPHADARTRRPGRGKRPCVQQVPEAALDRDVRRRQHQSADRCAQARRRHRRRTPGRLLDHMQQKTIDLSDLDILVLDEADRMLDMASFTTSARAREAAPAAPEPAARPPSPTRSRRSPTACSTRPR